MKPNIQKLNEVLETRFNNNKSEFAKALNIDWGQFCKILKEGNYTGTVFWSGLLIYCKSNVPPPAVALLLIQQDTPYKESEVLIMEKLVYTVQETAEILNIGMNKAYELIQQNQIPFIRVGRKFLIPKQALEKWLTESAGVKA